jgi:predicted dehydrogenase
VLVLGRFEDGAPFTMEMSWILPAHFGLGLDAGLDLLGTQGRIEVHGLDQGLRIADADAVTFPDTTRWVEYDDGSTGGILTAEIAHFLHAVRTGIPVGIPVEDAISAVCVAQAIEASLQSGQPMQVAP